MNDRYENKSVLMSATPGAYRVGIERNWEHDRMYSFLFKEKEASFETTKWMMKDTYLMKLIAHAKYAKNDYYDEWRNMRSNLGFAHLILLERTKKWKKEGHWDPNNWNFLVPGSPDQDQLIK